MSRALALGNATSRSSSRDQPRSDGFFRQSKERLHIEPSHSYFLTSNMLILRCSENEFLAEDEEPSRFLFHTEGKLMLLNEDDDEVEIGSFSVKYVDVT